MNKAILIISLLVCTMQIFGKTTDTATWAMPNTIYLIPTAVGGDMWLDFNQIWVFLGLDRKISNTSFLGANIGMIVYSEGTDAKGLLGGIPSRSSNGTNISCEHKIMIAKRFYYSSNIFGQYTKIYRIDSLAPSVIFDYRVNRICFGAYPKIGFASCSKRRVFTDIGIGFGAKYIASAVEGKLTAPSDEREAISGKWFEHGNVIKPCFIFQFKIGFCFGSNRKHVKV